MPNDYIDKIKIDANTTVDIKDTVSGYIPSPSGAASGDFLKYNGSAWVAGVVPGGASPSDTTPADSTETGSAGTSSAYSRGDHSHPKEVLYIEYNGSATLTEIKDWWDAGKTIFVDCNFTSTVGAISLPCVNCTSSLAKFSATWNGVEYWAEFDDVEWDSGEIELTSDTKTSFYTTSSTGASTQAKTTASITGCDLRAGNIIVVKFSNANTYTSTKITLNVNSTGAKDVWYQGAVTSSTNTLTWNAGDALTFIYTGSVYLYIGRDSNVFVATYGTTTYAEIENAYNANIPIIVKDTTGAHASTGTTNIYQLLDKTSLGFRFSSINNYLTVKFCFVNTSNTWSYSSRMGLYKVNDKTSNEAAADPGAITLDADDVGALSEDTEATDIGGAPTVIMPYTASSSYHTFYKLPKSTANGTTHLTFLIGPIEQINRSIPLGGMYAFGFRYTGGSDGGTVNNISYMPIFGPYDNTTSAPKEFGYYSDNNYFYFGFKAPTYSNNVRIIPLEGNAEQLRSDRFYVVSQTTTQPTGWTVVNPSTLVKETWGPVVSHSERAGSASGGGAFLASHGTSNKDALFVSTRTDTGNTIGFGVGSTGINRGIYDYTLNKWVLLVNASGVQLNGNASSVDGAINKADSKTSITSLANLKTQLTTWFGSVPENGSMLFYVTPSGSWSPFTNGSAIHVVISKGTAAGTATFYGRNGATPVIAMMTYVSSAWSDFTTMATTDDINTAIGSAILASY